MITYTIIMAVFLNLFILKQALFAKHNLLIARAAALLWVVPFMWVTFFEAGEAVKINLMNAISVSIVLTATWMVLDMVAMQRDMVAMRARRRERDKDIDDSE